jgi:hypothetical protein
MCRVRYQFFPSLCSRFERKVVYIVVSNSKEKEEIELEVNKYDEISDEKIINCEESG